MHHSPSHVASLKANLPNSLFKGEVDLQWGGGLYCSNKTVLDKCLEKVKGTSRKDLLNPEPIVMCVHLQPCFEGLRARVTRHWHISRSDPNTGHVFKDIPRFTYKRSKNLRDCRVNTLGAPAHFLSAPPSGKFRCNDGVERFLSPSYRKEIPGQGYNYMQH